MQRQLVIGIAKRGKRVGVSACVRVVVVLGRGVRRGSRVSRGSRVLLLSVVGSAWGWCGVVRRLRGDRRVRGVVRPISTGPGVLAGVLPGVVGQLLLNALGKETVLGVVSLPGLARNVARRAFNNMAHPTQVRGERVVFSGCPWVEAAEWLQ